MKIAAAIALEAWRFLFGFLLYGLVRRYLIGLFFWGKPFYSTLLGGWSRRFIR
jgi:hypothetical protein